MFTERERSWIPETGDKWSFTSNNGTTFSFTCLDGIEDDRIGGCKDYEGGNVLMLDQEESAPLIYIIYGFSVKQKGIRTGFIFHTGGMQEEFPIRVSQSMGCLDVTGEKPCNASSIGTNNVYIGTKVFNDNTYEGVIEMNDYEPNRIPEVDISRFYVNQRGILRIEFYSGEVWDRVF